METINTPCTNINTLIQQDLQHIWHPCAQMKDYETFHPLMIKSAEGAYLTLADNRKIIDAISSWWCKSLGHGHPHLKKALQKQLAQFEHVMLANTTNETIVALSKKLAGLTSTLDKIFFAGDGSCAVEIALKMSIHAQQILGNSKRTELAALKNGYHGETCAALSVSDLGIYRDPYQTLLTNCHFINNIPYVLNQADPLWHDCSAVWPEIEAELNANATTLAAIIIEPILQGAGGMLIYSQDFLSRLRKWTKQNHVFLIADEIMTGIGRTGQPLACNHANIEPDFICLSKGLTSGWLPFSAVLTNTAIYQLFYDDYEEGKSFLHSHTYTGNPLGASVALACLEVMEKDNIYDRVQKLNDTLGKLMDEIATKTGKLTRVRHIGAMVAADLIVEKNQHRVGYAVYKKAVELGALLRPLGNTLYWLPPLNTEMETLLKLQKITQDAILAVC